MNLVLVVKANCLIINKAVLNVKRALSSVLMLYDYVTRERCPVLSIRCPGDIAARLATPPQVLPAQDFRLTHLAFLGDCVANLTQLLST